jgi:hypothetical protein
MRISNCDSILTIQICYVKQEKMFKKVFRAIITIFILPCLLIGAVNFPSLALPNLLPGSGHLNTSFQKTCDMSHCNANLPKCPLCPASGSANLVLHLGSVLYLPILASSPFSISHVVLSDQEFVISIFRPPTTALQIS